MIQDMFVKNIQIHCLNVLSFDCVYCFLKLTISVPIPIMLLKTNIWRNILLELYLHFKQDSNYLFRSDLWKISKYTFFYNQRFYTVKPRYGGHAMNSGQNIKSQMWQSFLNCLSISNTLQ